MKFLSHVLFLFMLVTLLGFSEAFAQEAAAPEGPGMGGVVIQILVIFLIFWILVIKPQQKKVKQHIAMTEGLKKGDQIVTDGGVIGVVSKAADGDKIIQVEIATGVKVDVLRQTVKEFLDVRPSNTNKKKTETSPKKPSAKKKTANKGKK